MADLLEFVSLRAVECLNQKTDWGNALKSGLRDQETLVLESDTDEQLLLHIPFTQRCKISGIAFAAPSDGKGPKSVKLFVNRPTVGFSDAESTPSAAELTLAPSDLEGDAGKTIALKPARFTGVDVLSILVEGNQGDEETTVLSRLTLFGSAGETFDVAAIKKVEDK